MIDKYAPIIPYVGIGGIRLNSTKAEVEQVLGCPLEGKELLYDGEWSKYTIGNELSLFFVEEDDRLFEIETLPGYQGKLFGKIGTDTDEADLLRLEPTLEYDEFEEIYQSKEKGVIIMTDIPAQKAVWIAVYVEDLDELCGIK
ncbi:MAG: hypothetical protein ACI4PT_04395 [Candidatus Avoscillospira sp.]